MGILCERNEIFSTELVIAPFLMAVAHTVCCFFCECGLTEHCSKSESIREGWPILGQGYLYGISHIIKKVCVF